MSVPLLLRNRLKEVLARAGIDGAVFYTLLWRIGMAVSAAVAVLLLPLMLTPIEQGYYFTFDSLINLRVVFDLGFSVVITQFASHEMAGLEWTGLRTLTGAENAKANLAYLARVALTWYSLAAVLIAALLIPGGLYFFGSSSQAQQHVQWMLPWILLVLVTAFSLVLSPTFALLEGCGLVRNVAAMRAIEVGITSLVLWTGLRARIGLFAPALAGTAGLMWEFVWIYVSFSGLIADLWKTFPTGNLKWLRDIMPLQWRLAISWASGYCVFNSITPIIFYVKGAALAGRVGMTLMIAQGLLTLSIATVKTKVPRFGQLVALGRFEELDDLHRRSARHALLYALFGAVVFYLSILVMPHLGLSFQRRVLDPFPLALILLATIVNSVFQSQAFYLRAHKTEPFLLLALTDAALSLPAYYIGAKIGGTVGVASVFFTLSTAAAGWAALIFRRFRASRPCQLIQALKS